MKIRYGEGNVQLGKCHSGQISSRESLCQIIFRSGSCPFEEVSVGEMSVGDLSLEKCQLGNSPVGKLSINHPYNSSHNSPTAHHMIMIFGAQM